MFLNYQFIGDPLAKRIIIFLHEGLGSVAQWKNFPSKLCESTKSYGLVYDRKGYGKSDGTLKNRTTNYLHEAAAELADLIKNHVPSKYDVFLYGHSDGGSIALIFAAQHPLKIKGLITEAAHVFVEEITIEGVRNALPNFEIGKFNGLKKYHGDRFENVFFAWYNIWLNPDFWNWNITPLLQNITCPILIIQGQNDQFGSLKQVEDIDNLTAGKSTIFIPENCFHAPHKENQKDTLEQASTFLSNLK